MSELFHRCFETAVFALLVIIFGGCSKPSGFYVVPEHKDLGVIIDESRVAIAEFEIFNGLAQPVEIKHIYPSCTCANVELLKNPIPSGESTTLRVTADLSKMAGKQEFSVSFVTDSSEFPHKRLSFSAMVPATGTRQRRVSIGSFYPDSKLDFTLPENLFSRGSVEQLEEIQDNLDIATDLAKNPKGEVVLLLKGTAPQTVGTFSRKLLLRESISGEPLLGEGIVELELVGNVVARWDIKPDLYSGFISLSNDGGIIALIIARNTALISVDRKKTVLNVTATFSEEWLSLKNHSVASDKIELYIKVHSDKLEHLGAVQTAMVLTFKYADGDVESYSTNLFAHIDN